MNYNTSVYCELLNDCLNHPCSYETNGIVYELLGTRSYFKADELIEGTNTKYVEHEIEWYDTLDRNIKNHEGIEENKIWKSCAADDGSINSNYGWCIYSDDNCNQYRNAVDRLVKDKDTKKAIMVYTRPSIQTECNDGVHAKNDMICTCYTSTMIRDNLLWHLVHMRSNDIWYGLRNDLAWQQEVQKRMHAELKGQYHNLTLGPIVWFADSMHLYKRNVDNAKDMLKYYADECQKVTGTDCYR